MAENGVCRVCGCTEYNACEGGCWWVEEDLCSACADELSEGMCPDYEEWRTLRDNLAMKVLRTLDEMLDDIEARQKRRGIRNG